MSIYRKTNKILEFFQSVHVVLLIKQHTCKVSTPKLHTQKTIELFRFFTSNPTSPFLLFNYPHSTHDTPTCIMISPHHGTDPPPPRYWPPPATVLNTHYAGDLFLEEQEKFSLYWCSHSQWFFCWVIRMESGKRGGRDTGNTKPHAVIMDWFYAWPNIGFPIYQINQISEVTV